VANIVMLGCLTARAQLVPIAAMEEAISHTVPPKTVDLNLKAFRAGLALGGVTA
jgi:Pyruvate/2-oxoacid:ferredoxin oxidoreductase gamma subunit